ncbi:MAG: GNAT family protein [Terriglobales bacterium]
MLEGLSAIIRYAFEVLELRRLEANVLPENSRSLRLLKKLGFREIGLDEEYLAINGQVRPHILTSLTKPRWVERVTA